MVDEIGQLEADHFDAIMRLWLAVDRVPALAMCGDKFQMAGYGDLRPWHSPRWRTTTFVTDLHQPYRCLDVRYNAILRTLRTCKPAAVSKRHLTVGKIMRGRRAWPGDAPTVDDIRRVLREHPRTEILTCTRLGAHTINELAVAAKFPRRLPLATIDGDLEANPANYRSGRLLSDRGQLKALRVQVYRGMSLYITQNIRKDTDVVNGMKAKVVGFDVRSKGLRLLTATGYKVVLWRWTDPEHGGRAFYPVRPGYASTVNKFQGAELEHVTLYLDCPGVPGAAYTAMSRVKRGRDCLIGGAVTRHHFTPAR